jgi:DedD protein
MGLAFWRRNKRTADAASNRSSRRRTSAGSNGDNVGETDEATLLRARARRRLIGAAALLLAAAVVIPMFLDPKPRPVPDNIAIDIPSEKTPFSPRLSLPPVPGPGNVPVAPASEAAAPGAVAEPAPTKIDDEKKAAEKSKGTSATDAAKLEEQRARAALEGKAGNAADALPVVTKTGKFVVQAAAPASEAAASDLSERLKKSGLTPYTERTDTKDGVRYRVRLGPYASREDADKVRARLKTFGIIGNVVTL